MKRKLLLFRITATYVGTVIGAGFASGQEIIQFFTNVGFQGFWGIGLAAVLFALFGFMILFLAEKYQSSSYGDLIRGICGNKIGRMIDFWITLFLLGGLCVMLAGGGAIFAEHLNLSYSLGVIITALIVIITVVFGVQGVMIANTVIVPIMVIVTLAVNWLVVGDRGLQLEITSLADPANSNWLISSFLYISYNMTLAVGVLAPLGRGIKDQQTVYLGGVMGGLILGGLIFLNNLSICAYYPQALSYQVPMLYIAGHYGKSLQFMYILILWLEMITTAIGNAYGLAKKVEAFSSWSYRTIVISSVILAIPFSYWGFAHLVGFLYPLFGYLSLFFLVFLVINFTQGIFLPFLPKRKA